MSLKISFLTIGSELLDGRITNTNVKRLADILKKDNLKISSVLSVNDTIIDITSALKYLETVSDVIITSGGLGPTVDDLTREAISKYTNSTLIKSTEHFEYLKELFKKKNKKFSLCNEQQTFIPKESLILKNSIGTALCFGLKHKDLLILSAPGVPSEFIEVIQNDGLNLIKKHFKIVSKKDDFKSLTIINHSESILNEVAVRNCSKETELIFQVRSPEIILILKNKDRDQLEKEFNLIIKELKNETVYSIDQKKYLIDEFKEKSKSINKILINKSIEYNFLNIFYNDLGSVFFNQIIISKTSQTISFSKNDLVLKIEEENENLVYKASFNNKQITNKYPYPVNKREKRNCGLNFIFQVLNKLLI